MPSLRKVLEAILSGRSDQNVAFTDPQRVLRRAGFQERIRGSHCIYWRQGVDEIINIQAAAGGKAKAYQVKQVRNLLAKYGLTQID